MRLLFRSSGLLMRPGQRDGARHLDALQVLGRAQPATREDQFRSGPGRTPEDLHPREPTVRPGRL